MNMHSNHLEMESCYQYMELSHLGMNTLGWTIVTGLKMDSSQLTIGSSYLEMGSSRLEMDSSQLKISSRDLEMDSSRVEIDSSYLKSSPGIQSHILVAPVHLESM